MCVWIDNCRRVKAFYKSDYYQYLKDEHPGFIRSVINSIMEDPDKCDNKLSISPKIAKLGEIDK